MYLNFSFIALPYYKGTIGAVIVAVGIFEVKEYTTSLEIVIENLLGQIQ